MAAIRYALSPTRIVLFILQGMTLIRIWRLSRDIRQLEKTLKGTFGPYRGTLNFMIVDLERQLVREQALFDRQEDTRMYLRIKEAFV